MPNCKIHRDTTLVCLRCMGAKGGKQTAKDHPEEVGRWAAKGRRARAAKKKRETLQPPVARS